MKEFTKVLLLLLSLSAWLAPAECVAQQKSDVEAQAREFMARGLEAEGQGRVDDALDAYAKSFELHPSYDVAGNMGLIEVKLQRYLVAAEHLSYCLRNYPTGENRDLKALLEESLAVAERYVARVTIDVNKEGAKIFVDGEEVGRAPLEGPVYLMGGEHILRAEGQGESGETTFVAEKGQATEVSLGLQPPSVRKPEKDEDDDPVGDETNTPRARRNWVPAYVLGGVTVAALGTSIVFRSLAGGQKKKIDDLKPSSPSGCVGSTTADCQDLQDAEKAYNTHRTVSHTTMIVAGVGAAATMGYVIYTLTKSEKPSRVGMTAWFDGSAAVASVSGRF